MVSVGDAIPASLYHRTTYAGRGRTLCVVRVCLLLHSHLIGHSAWYHSDGAESGLPRVTSRFDGCLPSEPRSCDIHDSPLCAVCDGRRTPALTAMIAWLYSIWMHSHDSGRIHPSSNVHRDARLCSSNSHNFTNGMADARAT